MKDGGGVVPGADVVLLNEATSVARSTTSNEAGEYNFPNLAPGTYTLKVSLQGYKGYALPAVRVGTQQFLTLDVTLEVGQLAETVTVRGDTPVIETSTASTGTVIDSQALPTPPVTGGRPTVAAATAEVHKCAMAMRYYADHAEGYLASIDYDPDAVNARRALTIWQPLGVVLAIMPWNFPLWQTVRLAAPALMAGKTGQLKRASHGAQTAE